MLSNYIKLSGEGGSFFIFRLCKPILFFCSLNFIVLFQLSIKYCHMLFLLLLYLDSVVVSWSQLSSTDFPQGISQGCDSSLWGGWLIFHFRLFKSIFGEELNSSMLFLSLIQYQHVMFIIIVCDYVLIRNFSCFFARFLLYPTLARDQSRDVTARLGIFILQCTSSLFSSVLHLHSGYYILAQLFNNTRAEALVVKQKFTVGG